jgi:hypothetical protein
VLRLACRGWGSFFTTGASRERCDFHRHPLGVQRLIDRSKPDRHRPACGCGSDDVNLNSPIASSDRWGPRESDDDFVVAGMPDERSRPSIAASPGRLGVSYDQALDV